MDNKSKNAAYKFSGARYKKLRKLEQLLNYRFKNINLLNLALTHSSYANEKSDKHLDNNEKLEFLGDSVLELIISEHLFERYPDFVEGELTKLRAELVNATSLTAKSLQLDLGEYLLLGKGEEQSGGRNKASLLSDCLESTIGSIFLDGGYRVARKFIRHLFKHEIETVSKTESLSDFKTHLQEITQKAYGATPTYKLVSSVGPDHDRTFYVSVGIKKEIFGSGSGKTKKDAEQMAAREALQKLLPEESPED
jgi:ribonuclease III